jgi:hypothetical protein
MTTVKKYRSFARIEGTVSGVEYRARWQAVEAVVEGWSHVVILVAI